MIVRRRLPGVMLAPGSVNAAWRRLRSDVAPWSERVGAEAFEANMPLHLITLLRELESGRYRPQAVRQTRLARPDGKERILSLHYRRDKFAQRLALAWLDPLGERMFHPDSHGFRRGRGVHTALSVARERVHTGRPWLVDADIRSFFDRVPHRPLRRRVARVVPYRGLRQLIDQWLVAGPTTGSVLGGARGLMQGAVISPWLCNLYLDTLDRAWSRANIPFVRYADDFLLFTETRAEAERALAFTAERLGNLGLALHPDKTRIVRAEDSPRFLGEPLWRRCRAKRGRR